MKKVFIVTSGEDSYYAIEKVFSTKEKANAYVVGKGEQYRIEEYLLND